MSQENIEVVRRVYEAWMTGDYEAVFDLFDSEIEWVPPPDVSSSGERRGHEGVRQAMAGWMGSWEDYHFELRRLIDSGDQVLADGWQRARGRTSGVEVSEEIFSVWTLRAGQVVRQRMFRDRAQARAAAGLTESI
jgi:ketosteroid isomerase-like protein